MNYVGKMIICIIIMAGLVTGMVVVNTIDFEKISYADEDVLPSQIINSENTNDGNTLGDLYADVPLEVPYDPYIPEVSSEIADITTTPVNFEKNEEAVTIAAMGDIFVPPSLIASTKTSTGYDFDPVFKYIKPYIQIADMAIANLNSPVAGEIAGYSSYSGDSYISNAPIEILDALKETGFDVVVTANGRALDKGKIGVERTINELKEKQLIGSGTYIIDDERSVVIETIKDIKIAICSYTTAMDINYEGIDTGYNVVQLRDAVDFINKEKIIEDLKELKTMGAQAIVLNLCYNEKGENIPSQKQLELAELFIKEGASIVVGSGTNNLQGIDVYTNDENKGVVMHSLGNSLTEQQNKEESIITFIDITKEDDKVKIENVRYIPTISYGADNTVSILPCNPSSYDFFDENMKKVVKETYEATVNLIGRKIALPAK